MENSFGTIELSFFFLIKILAFLRCSGIEYLLSNLLRVFIILDMKVSSFLSLTESSCLVSTDLDSKGGDDKAGKNDLGTTEHGIGEILGSNESREVVTGVEALIATSSGKEALEKSSSEVQEVVPVVHVDQLCHFLL